MKKTSVLIPSYPSITRLAEALTLRSLSSRTRGEYVRYVRKLAGHFGTDPESLDETQAHAYLLYLKEQKQYAPSSMRIAASALRFLFNEVLGRGWKLFDLVRSPSRQTLPVVLSREEVVAIIEHTRQPRFRTALRLIYSSVLSTRFRDRFHERLEADAPELYALVPAEVWVKDWVVHSQPVGGGLQALMYLSAYVYRTALSNKRIISGRGGRITFASTESATGFARTCTLEACEFLRRFLQHVLPGGCHKVRYFGWLHPRADKRFRLVQALLAVALILSEPARTVSPSPHLRCPHCGEFALEAVACIKREPP